MLIINHMLCFVYINRVIFSCRLVGDRLVSRGHTVTQIRYGQSGISLVNYFRLN